MTTNHSSADYVPVLIVGGGVVGLSAALLMQYHGVDFDLVERRDGPSALPRSRGVHTRTVEIFRQLGVEEHVLRASAHALKAGKFGGARHGATMLDSVPLPIMRSPLGDRDTASPSRFCFLPQVELEPVLIDRCRQRGGMLRFGTELTEFAADMDGVIAVVTDVATGRQHTIRCEYLIAADGAMSGVRRSLSIGSWELPPTHHYINVFFRADLADRVAGRTFSQCQIDNDVVRGLMLSKNNTDEWSLHIEYDPGRETLDDYPPERCAELVRAAIGAHTIEVDVVARSAWDTGVQVTDRYRHGRVLIAGDAAHRHAPWGGFGANTGVSDVHNLAWKLAAVLGRHADAGLLDTYQLERRPRAIAGAEQARLRTDFQTRYNVVTTVNIAETAQLRDLDTVMMKYRYESPAVLGAQSDESYVDTLCGQAGTRVPHLWMARGDERLSTLDVCGPGFALITDVDAAEWTAAAQRAHAETGLVVAVHAVGTELVDVDRVWRTATNLPYGGALLVRPDQHVLARSDETLRPHTLTALLRTVTSATLVR